MGFQLSPGVNVSEIDLTNVVPGVSSSVGAFAGQFSWGPANIRTLVDSENKLVSIFGKPNNDSNTYTSFFSAANFLAYTNNIRVVRAINDTTTFNATSISELIDLETVAADATSGNNYIRFNTDIADYLASGDKFTISYGANTSLLEVVEIHNGNTALVVNNLIGNATAGSITLPTYQTNVSIANEEDYEINFSLGQHPKFGAFYGRYPGDFGNSLTVSVCSSANSFSRTGLTANTTLHSTSAVLNTGLANTFLNAGDSITIDGHAYTVGSIGATNLVSTNITLTTGALTQKNNATTTTKWVYADNFDSAPSTSSTVDSKGSSNDELHVIVIDTDGKFTGERGTVLEKFAHLSKADNATTDDGSPNYYATRIFNESKYIYVANHVSGSSNWGLVTNNGLSYDKLPNYSVKLSNGTDDSALDSDYITAYNLFQNADESDISLLITGDCSQRPGTLSRCLSIANERKDCVAFVSPKRADAVSAVDIDKIIEYRNGLSPSTSYSVFDSGWKYQFDKYNNKYRYVPLNGDIAGLCARTDNTRDPWWSPAGFNRGQILNAIKVSYNPTKAQRDELYKNGINPVLAFPGEGIILYGDKTMQKKPSAFDRINVRRLFIVLEKAIAIAAKYSLFEFNDAFTRAQFVAMVEPFLRDVKGRRGIYDFKVICDESNNTPEVIDTNRFIGDIYIKPARSINFIQLNFVAVRTGVDFTEVAGKF